MEPLTPCVDPLRVYVVGGGMQYIRMFYDAGYRGAQGVEDADLVCFTGGSDVTPAFYDEAPLKCTYFNVNRDIEEKTVFEACVKNNTPMVGICRGAQFLNVMNGGRLWQDVNNHTCGVHTVMDMHGNRILSVTSTHHQQMIPTEAAVVLAKCGRSTEKFGFGKELSCTVEQAAAANEDVEVVWYEDTACLCFQPHPEFNPGQCRDYFLELVDDYILANGAE